MFYTNFDKTCEQNIDVQSCMLEKWDKLTLVKSNLVLFVNENHTWLSKQIIDGVRCKSVTNFEKLFLLFCAPKIEKCNENKKNDQNEKIGKITSIFIHLSVRSTTLKTHILTYICQSWCISIYHNDKVVGLTKNVQHNALGMLDFLL
jgi:hypothetical protein